MFMMHSTFALTLIAVSVAMMMVVKMPDGFMKMVGYVVTLFALLLFVCSVYTGFMAWRSGNMNMNMMQDMTNMMKGGEMMKNNGTMPAEKTPAAH